MDAQINLSQCFNVWKARTRGMAARVLVGGLSLMGTSAWAALPPGPPPAPQCAVPAGEKLFQARFTDNSSGQSREMTLAILRVTPRNGDKPGIVAQIRNSKGCEAVCQLRRFDPEDSLAAQSMDLDCRGAGLGHLVTPATVFWAKTRPLNESDRAPALRFGTWLHGYVRVPLRVEVDRYTPDSVPSRIAAPVLKAKGVHVASASLKR